MILRFFYSLLATILFCNTISAQTGTIRGSVFDDGTGESLPGVTIFLEGTTKGTLTDFDGIFSLNTDPGVYTLRISYISYETTVIKDLVVKAGEVTLLDEIRLKEALIQLSEVVVSAQATRNTETAILTMKQKSASLIDGISSSAFRKTGDSDAAGSLKRVTGVSVEGGKYVYVRGLGDRYTKTTLNGMEIPGLDPDRNTLQLDIFPTNIIDNIIISKTFTADLPADFTGGIIDISTKDFPETKTFDVSVNVSYNPLMHFNSDYLTYKGGSTDFLGFDDGTRAIPATENIPLFSEVVGNPSGERAQRFREILGKFNPTLAATTAQSKPDYGISISAGNQYSGGKRTWGFFTALTYKNNTEFYKNAEFGRYGLSGDSDITDMQAREYQTGSYGTNSVLTGGMAGISMKTTAYKVSLNVLHLQNGESKAGVFDFINNDQGSYFEGVQHNLEYSQRALTNLLLKGDHYKLENQFRLNWRLSYTNSSIDDPDIRFTRYEIRDGRFIIGTESGFPERIWRNLLEKNLAGRVSFEKEFTLAQRKSVFSAGLSAVFKHRDYVIRNFMVNVRNLELTGNPDELFMAANLWPYNGNINKGTTYETPFIPTNPNLFNAESRNLAGYASLEFNPSKKLKGILGVRAEKYDQYYTGSDQLGLRVLDNEKLTDEFSLFPSVNLTYSHTARQNIRFSYARTVARPSFRELSFAEIFDPISGKVFIGGLFPDADEVSNTVYWDGNLQNTDIHNADLRWEYFGENSETVSLSAFYKYFINPIEIVQYSTQTGAFQPRNVGDGRVLGLELEIRKNLGFIVPDLKNVSLLANLTFANSSIRLSETEFESRVANARTGQDIKEYRPMAGQAPYLINTGLTYEGRSGFGENLEIALFYNIQGRTLEAVGIVDRPDIYTMPFNSLNLNANKGFGKTNKLRVGIKIENILNDFRESVFSSYRTENMFYSRLEQGITYQLRLTCKIF